LTPATNLVVKLTVDLTMHCLVHPLERLLEMSAQDEKFNDFDRIWEMKTRAATSVPLEMV